MLPPTTSRPSNSRIPPGSTRTSPRTLAPLRSQPAPGGTSTSPDTVPLIVFVHMTAAAAPPALTITPAANHDNATPRVTNRLITPPYTASAIDGTEAVLRPDGVFAPLYVRRSINLVDAP